MCIHVILYNLYINISCCLSRENISPYGSMGHFSSPWHGPKRAIWVKKPRGEDCDFVRLPVQSSTSFNVYYIYIYKYYLILNIIYIYVFRGLKIMSLFFCGGDHVHFISAGSFSHVPRLRRRQFRPRKAGSNRRCGWEHRKHRTPNFPADRGFPLFKPFHVVSLQCHQLEKWLGMGFPYHRPKHGFLTGGAFMAWF